MFMEFPIQFGILRNPLLKNDLLFILLFGFEHEFVCSCFRKSSTFLPQNSFYNVLVLIWQDLVTYLESLLQYNHVPYFDNEVISQKRKDLVQMSDCSLTMYVVNVRLLTYIH